MIKDGITYAQRRTFNGGISPDNGQGMAATLTCTRFSCQEWDGNNPVSPILIGGQHCPKCRASYGTANADAVRALAQQVR